MRIAIQLSGEPRFTIGFQSFLENLKGYDHADWFVYLTNNNEQAKKDVLLPETWKKFDPEWAIEKIKNNLPKNNYLQVFEISNVNECSWPSSAKNTHCLMGSNPVERVYKMHYNIFKANQLRINYQEANNIKYDFIVRPRPDNNIDCAIDLRNFKISDNEIVMPKNNWFGNEKIDMTTNDQFAIGTPLSMNVYSELVDFIKEYNDNGVRFHPESLFAHHLHVRNIKTIRGDFESYVKRSPFLENWC